MKRDEVRTVEMVRSIRDEQHETLKDMRPEERREFFRKEAEALHRSLGIKETLARS